MIRLTDDANAKLDLATANILIVGERMTELDVLAQVLMGFGAPGIQRCTSAGEALEIASNDAFDLALVDVALQPEDGYSLISSMRRQPQTFVKHLPIILVCGHVRRADVMKARDCGASFVLSKPISPHVLFNRIVLLARDQRQFIECDTYVGPDRRFKAYGPPTGMKGRRRDDLSADLGAAKEANLSQDEVDGFFSTKKASL
jgi:DNA-binding response OmpR family regulator